MNEEKRIELLNQLKILDTLPEDDYDSISKMASYICDMPITLITLSDRQRQWFKSHIGLDVYETSRHESFCDYTMRQSSVMIVEDAKKDVRFVQHALVTGHPNIRFYAGAPICVNGINIGSLCVIDSRPRHLNPKQKECLETLSKYVSKLLLHRKYEIIASASLQELSDILTSSQNDNNLLAMKKELITNVSHEVRTPLNAIVASVESLLYMTNSDDTRTELFHTIQNASDDINIVFTNMINLTSGQQIQCEPRCVEIHSKISDLISNFKIKAQEKLVVLYSTECTDALYVEIDVNHVVTVFSNLISNAIKFTPSNGSVSVTYDITAESNYKAVLFVRVDDTGNGIDVIDLERIFEPLTQTDMSSTKSHQGAGNGLAVAKNIVDATGGEIRYTSKVGVGTSFTVLMPIKLSLHQPVVRRLFTVMIVDDIAVNRKIMTTLTKRLLKGIVILTAENGLEAVHKTASIQSLDLILLDLQMPVLDGFQAAQQIRKQNTHKDLIIVAVTASSESSDHKKCFDVGMNGVIEKPVTLKILEHQLNKWFKI